MVKGTDPLDPGFIVYGLKGLGFKSQQTKETFLFPKYTDLPWKHPAGVLSRSKVAKV
jgi:hypothetical protein